MYFNDNSFLEFGWLVWMINEKDLLYINYFTKHYTQRERFNCSNFPFMSSVRFFFFLLPTLLHSSLCNENEKKKYKLILKEEIRFFVAVIFMYWQVN